MHSGDELACLLVDECQELEGLQVEGEVLDVLCHFDDANDQLDEWVDEENEV